jgi:hypothetical protein
MAVSRNPENQKTNLVVKSENGDHDEDVDDFKDRDHVGKLRKQNEPS